MVEAKIQIATPTLADIPENEADEVDDDWSDDAADEVADEKVDVDVPVQADIAPEKDFPRKNCLMCKSYTHDQVCTLCEYKDLDISSEVSYEHPRIEVPQAVVTKIPLKTKKKTIRRKKRVFKKKNKKVVAQITREQ